MILLFKMPPSIALASVPEHKKAVMSLMEKIRVLDKLRSGMSYSAIGHRLC